MKSEMDEFQLTLVARCCDVILADKKAKLTSLEKFEKILKRRLCDWESTEAVGKSQPDTNAEGNQTMKGYMVVLLEEIEREISSGRLHHGSSAADLVRGIIRRV